MFESSEIAAYLIRGAQKCTGSPPTRRTLERLLFYAQGFHLALFGAPLFTDDILADAEGPFVAVLRDRFPAEPRQPLPLEDTDVPSGLSPLLQGFLDEVCSEFAAYIPWKHPEVTREQFENEFYSPPWREALEQGRAISHAAMRSHFSRLVDLG